MTGQAIQYWEQHGANSAQLALLQRANVTITNLGGLVLAGTDQQGVWIDDDAAGHGWSTGINEVAPDKVDLLSAVTHEFGHMLGYDHDVMGSILGIGDRHLPFASPSNAPDPLSLMLAG